MNQSLPSQPQLPDLSHEILRRAFPFFLQWNDELILTSYGPSVAKVCPSVAHGKSIDEILTLKRPVGKISAEFFRSSGDLLILFGIIGNDLLLRGEVITLSEKRGFLILGAPWIDDPEQVAQHQLTVSDFAIHDQTMDLLQIVQTQRMANDDLQRLTQKLTAQRTQLRAKEAEARKLAIVAAKTDNAVIVTDARGRIEWVNDGFVRLTEFRLEESIGKTPGQLLQGPETDPITVAFMREKLEKQEGFRVEILNYSKSGAKYWISVEIQPIFDASGKLTNFMGIESDITQKIMDERRRNTQHAVTRILASDRSLADASAKIIRTLCDSLGYVMGCLWMPDENLEKLLLTDLWHDPQLDCRTFIEISRALSYAKGEGLPGKVWQSETKVFIDDVSVESTFRRSTAANVCGFRSAFAMPIFHNAVFLGMLEFFSQKREKPDDLFVETLDGISYQIGQYIVRKKSQMEMIRAKEAAENANRAKSDFLATMSHEIRTPMNGVMGFAHLLKQSKLTSEQTEFVTAITSSAESLLRVINDVLDFSKIESGHMELESSPFSLQLCIEEALDTVVANAAEKQLELVSIVHADVPHSIFGDSLRLKQVLVNLLGNAVKFTHVGEVVLEVGTKVMADDEHELEFTIRDTGIGIAEDRVDQLFNAFQQEDSSTSRRFGGSGLGLAICKRLVELMGGQIAVSSVQGKGSVFSFRITAAKSSEPAPLIGPLPAPDLMNRKALIIEGHNLSRQVMSELLLRWGLDVRSAASPAESAKHIKAEWHPDFLLLDSRFVDLSDIAFAKDLVHQGTALFLQCQPAEGIAPRERYGMENIFVQFKPIKVSPLFNALISHANSRSSKQMSQPKASEKTVPKSTLRLLLAEDNKINQKLALAVLNQLGYTADLVVNGEEAVHAVKAKTYDAILMDVQMPGMDGLEATRKIREWENATSAPRVHIIALTANALVGDREICLDAGMDQYLSKPIRVDALRNALRDAQSESVDSAKFPAKEDSPVTSALKLLAEQLTREDALSLASDFLCDIDQQLQEIHDALEAENYQDVRRLAHSLKGTSSIFSLTELNQVAEHLEHLCRDSHNQEAQQTWSKLQDSAAKAASQLREAITEITYGEIFDPMS